MSNHHPITATAATIAAQLGETHAGARATIWRCVHTLGPERAQAFVTQSLEVEANGGMLVPDGSRRRTLGGIFFYLVRTQISDTRRCRLIGHGAGNSGSTAGLRKPKASTTLTPPLLPLFVWDEADPIITE